MSVEKMITGYWGVEGYPRGHIFHQQRYRPSDSNKNVDITSSGHDAFLE